MKYQCIKIVDAEPMNRCEAESLGLVRDVTGIDEEGFMVKYSEGYTSWSPKEAFKKGYVPYS